MRRNHTLPVTAAFFSILSAGPTYAQTVTPAQVVDSLQSTFGTHAGQRRNHTKGTCAAGMFVGAPSAAVYSKSLLFQGSQIPVIARFSVAGGNPSAPDATRNARGMALEFRLADGGRQHMTMLNTPMFGAAQPETFNALVLAGKPDPTTGKPDPEAVRAVLAAHPDAKAQWQYLADHNPPPSYANSAFYGIHTFQFVDAGGALHPVRWRFVPRDGEKSLSNAELAAAPKDFLERRLLRRVARGPIQWDMVVYLGEPGDPVVDPTVTWPEERKHFVAGTLTIKSATVQAGGECEKINFDPLVMAAGIAPSADPILLFRSPAYAVSFGRRLSGK
jgi:catalase